jgi:hypothetical protein
MKFKRYRVTVSDRDGVLMDVFFWTQGGALSYLHNWVKWYVKKYADTPTMEPALYIRVRRFVAGRWIPMFSTGHYDYLNELVRLAVIV